MTIDVLSAIFADHPLFALFRKQNPALALSFLYAAFKKRGVLVVLQDELLIDLAYYIEEYGEEADDPLSLINDWCGEKLRLIRRFRNEEGFWVLELTPVAEKGIQWLEELTESSPVATESRFTDILERLENLLSGSLRDPEMRIRELEGKKEDIEKEIREIKASGEVTSHLDDRQVNERLREIVKSARNLVADFSIVEEDYRRLLTEIYREEAEQDTTRGHIVGTALNTSERLDASPQGQSFRAFWRYLISDYGGNRISELVRDLEEIHREGKGEGGLDTGYLRDFKGRLFESGRKIVETNRRLGERLHRILESHELLRTRRLLQDIREVRNLAVNFQGELPRKTFHLRGMTPSVNLPLERPLSLPVEKRRMTSLLEVGGDEMEDWSFLALPDGIDMDLISSRVDVLVTELGSVTLEEVLRRHPPQMGLPEIMAYFRLAVIRPASRIDSTRNWSIVISGEKRQRRLSIPEVIYG